MTTTSTDRRAADMGLLDRVIRRMIPMADAPNERLEVLGPDKRQVIQAVFLTNPALAAEIERGRQRAALTEEDRQRKRSLERAQSEEDRRFVLEQCRSASADEYRVWLAGYLASGGVPGDRRPYEPAGFLMARLSYLSMRPLYGARSVRIIVPDGCTVAGGLGHSELYRQNEYRFYADNVFRVVDYTGEED